MRPLHLNSEVRLKTTTFSFCSEDRHIPHTITVTGTLLSDEDVNSNPLLVLFTPMPSITLSSCYVPFCVPSIGPGLVYRTNKYFPSIHFLLQNIFRFTEKLRRQYRVPKPQGAGSIICQCGNFVTVHEAILIHYCSLTPVLYSYFSHFFSWDPFRIPHSFNCASLGSFLLGESHSFFVCLFLSSFRFKEK